MEYTKRDLELFILLSKSLNRFMSGYGASKGLCGCMCDMMREHRIGGRESQRMEMILEKEFIKIIPEYQTGMGIYVWEKRAIEPRKKFLDDLIEKIKNSLSD